MAKTYTDDELDISEATVKCVLDFYADLIQNKKIERTKALRRTGDRFNFKTAYVEALLAKHTDNVKKGVQ